MSDKHIRIWFALFVLAVFGVGLASGVLIGRRMAGPPRGWDARGRGPMAIGPGGRGGLPREVMLERLSEDLDLTAEQRTQIDTVLRSSRERIQQLQGDVRGRFEKEQRRLREEIRKVLTPEQQERFDQRVLMPGRRRGPPNR